MMCWKSIVFDTTVNDLNHLMYHSWCETTKNSFKILHYYSPLTREYVDTRGPFNNVDSIQTRMDK